MPNRWGPNFVIPSETVTRYSGTVMLRETLDEELLSRELEEMGIRGNIERIINPWYFRKKEDASWVKIGESEYGPDEFSVRWNTRAVDDGDYQILGLMHVHVNSDRGDHIIARESIVEVKVSNCA